ncbi:hypothetical protein U9M48_004561 [Paspalum notatum var. saurae]|uniref:F-box domain-containing protein n=1 Tax=Paspalum notatum var. saurae TaxID=547442 RepID=A0AAQ3PKP6_PASNO
MFQPMNAKKGAPAATGGAGHIGDLPEGVLHHILSFLLARDAVRTSLLGRRWRDLWTSAPGLRILLGDDDDGRASVAHYRDFVNHLLLLRGNAALDTCEISFGVIQDERDPCLNLWFRHAVRCNARRLRLESVLHRGLLFVLDDLPLASRHLARLELVGVLLMYSFCNFSGCPTLQHLEMSRCYLSCAKKIVSESLKCLKITRCSFSEWYRMVISVPGLLSLRLDGNLNRAPALGSMPLLQEAFVRLTHFLEYADYCSGADFGECGDVNCISCYSMEHNFNSSKNSVPLGGLSEAESLALIAESKTFIYRRVLKQCPTFSNLKTLLLNDYWCVAPDFYELTCILRHSPILEKLTLQLFSTGRHKQNLRVKGSPNPTRLSAAISTHLQIVDVKCAVIDGRILKILKFLSTLGIGFSLDKMEILEE